jgi:pullulanase
MTKRWTIPAALLLALVSCSSEDPINQEPPAGFLFRVAVPNTTPATDTVYLTGDFQGWDPGDPDFALTDLSDDWWEIHLTLPEGQLMEFKFTRGSWETIERGSAGEETPNRTLLPAEGQLYEFAVARWADQ